MYSVAYSLAMNSVPRTLPVPLNEKSVDLVFVIDSSFYSVDIFTSNVRQSVGLPGFS